MSGWYRNDEEQRGYDARQGDRFSNRYESGFDFEQGWIERDREERRAQERRDEQRQMEEQREHEEYQRHLDSQREPEPEQQTEEGSTT
jgi:hypothetical protein